MFITLQVVKMNPLVLRVYLESKIWTFISLKVTKINPLVFRV